MIKIKYLPDISKIFTDFINESQANTLNHLHLQLIYQHFGDVVKTQKKIF